MDLSADLLIERIKEFVSIKDLEKIGFQVNTVYNWKIRNSIPKADDLFKIAQFCGCSMEYLLTGQKIDLDSVFLSADEQQLLNDFKKMDSDSKKSVLKISEALAGK